MSIMEDSIEIARQIGCGEAEKSEDRFRALRDSIFKKERSIGQCLDEFINDGSKLHVCSIACICSRLGDSFGEGSTSTFRLL